MRSPPLKSTYLVAIGLVFAFHFPKLIGAEQIFDLRVSEFGNPNTTSGDWTESGLGSNSLTYKHKSGVVVALETESGVFRRGKEAGLLFLGINNSVISPGQVLKIRITGVQGDAVMREFQFAQLTKNEALNITAPALSLFIGNGGRIGAGLYATARNNDGSGVSIVGGLQADPTKICAVSYRGANKAKGFPLGTKEVLTLKPRANSDFALAGITFSGLLFPTGSNTELLTTRTGTKSDLKEVRGQMGVRIKERTDGAAEVTVDVIEGSARSFSNVQFKLGSAEFTGGTTPAQLEKIALFVKESGSFLIEGHTCDLGSAQSNLLLSEQRAEAVKDFLVKKGIPADRLVTIGYGEREPVVENSESLRHLNRRVVIYQRKSPQ